MVGTEPAPRKPTISLVDPLAIGPVVVPNRGRSGPDVRHYRRAFPPPGRAARCRSGGIGNDGVRRLGARGTRGQRSQRGCRDRDPRRAARRVRAAMDGRRRPHRRGARRRHHRHQHGLPLQAGYQRRCGLGADARPRPRPKPDRGNGVRCARAGYAEDAARLGHVNHQCARACAARGSRRHQIDHRARPHTVSIFRRTR